MDKKSKFLIAIFIIIMLISIFFTYQRAFVDKDFEIISSEEETGEEVNFEE